MKKLLLIGCIAFATAATAQMKQGRVVYQRTIQMNLPRFQGPDANVPDLPRSRTDNFEVLFANNQSLWQSIPDANEEANTVAGNGGGNFFRFGGTDDVAYYNFETGKHIDQREIASRSFVIEDSITKLNWKLSNETKAILGHTAHKATAQSYGTRMQMVMENGEMKRQQVADTSNVTAWFTTDVPVSVGPQNFQGQLPGLILELTLNNGRTVYKATEVSDKVNPKNIKEPKDGKRLTAAEFAKERDKIFEEMRRNMPNGGPGGRMRIVTQ